MHAAPVAGDSLLIVVVGASGDLAKKKTYPALFELYLARLLPSSAIICGYARSELTGDEFTVRISCLFVKPSFCSCAVLDWLFVYIMALEVHELRKPIICKISEVLYGAVNSRCCCVFLYTVLCVDGRLLRSACRLVCAHF